VREANQNARLAGATGARIGISALGGGNAP
jgi:hypothetical protein